MRVVVLTGASSGIGAATALRLGAKGDHLVLVARRTSALQQIAEQIRASGGAADVVRADLAKDTEVGGIIPRAVELAGSVDALINCAGVGGAASIRTPPVDVEHMLRVNLHAPIRLMHDVVPHFLAQKRGSIVNVGSLAGEIGVRGAYSASKFGLRGITDSVRHELRRTGIIVSLVEPSALDTPMSAKRARQLPHPDLAAVAIQDALLRTYRRLYVPRRAALTVAISQALPCMVNTFARRIPSSGDKW